MAKLCEGAKQAVGNPIHCPGCVDCMADGTPKKAPVTEAKKYEIKKGK